MNRLVLMIVVAVLIAGCSSIPTETTPIENGSDSPATTVLTFHYTGFTRDGRAAVQGMLYLSPERNGHFTGRWRLRALIDPSRLGPQVGEGTLTGVTANGALVVYLNPQMADNNVVLTGRLDCNSYAGRWEWIGLAGTINGGAFSAVRRVSTDPALIQ